MLLWVGNSGAGDHKGGVGIVLALTQPTKPPQNKGCVAAKHSPAPKLNHVPPQSILISADSDTPYSDTEELRPLAL